MQKPSPSSDPANLVARLPSSLVYWHDDQRTILVHEVTRKWTWEEAHAALRLVNDTLLKHSGDVYSIHWFRPSSAILPAGDALVNLRKLIAPDPPNERLVIIVGGSALLGAFLRTVLRVYSRTTAMPKYHFVDTLEEALRLVDTYRPSASE
jgi:hypothetical protein